MALNDGHPTEGEPDPRLGTSISDNLALVAALGRGAMGAVYRARQKSMDRDVAVKLMHPSAGANATAVRRFLQEAKAASKLRHPGIITVFDFGQTAEGALYLVMELLEGRPLADALEGEAPMAATRVVHIMTQVADAAHHAHEHGLVHRDLKPENVFLLNASGMQRDFVKVLDFGIARTLEGDAGDKVTLTGQVCGTPTYMSPEQAMGAAIDRRSDIYAMGVMTFELLTGRAPFEADTMMRVMRAHVRDPVPAMATVAPVAVPQALEAVVRQALAKAPADRFPNALAFAKALGAALSEGTAEPTRGSMREPEHGARALASGGPPGLLALADTGVAGIPETLLAASPRAAETAPQRVPDAADLVDPPRHRRARLATVAMVVVGAVVLAALGMLAVRRPTTTESTVTGPTIAVSYLGAPELGGTRPDLREPEPAPVIAAPLPTSPDSPPSPAPTPPVAATPKKPPPPRPPVAAAKPLPTDQGQIE